MSNGNRRMGRKRSESGGKEENWGAKIEKKREVSASQFACVSSSNRNENRSRVRRRADREEELNRNHEL